MCRDVIKQGGELLRHVSSRIPFDDGGIALVRKTAAVLPRPPRADEVLRNRCRRAARRARARGAEQIIKLPAVGRDGQDWPARTEVLERFAGIKASAQELVAIARRVYRQQE